MMNSISKEKTKQLKGIAIFLVVICHILNQYTRYATPLGGIGVSIFLFLSSYGLCHSLCKNGLTDFWKKRFFNVVTPYWIVEFFLYMIFIHPYLKEVILDLTFIHVLHPIGWYLNYLFVWYAIFWMVMMFTKDDRDKFVAFMIAAFTLSLYSFFYSSIRFEQSFSFLLGLFFYKMKNSDIVLGKKVLIACFVLGVAGLAIKQLNIVRAIPQYLNILDLIVKTSCLLFVINLSFCVNTNYNVFNILGDYSYEIYLIHGAFLILYHLDINKNISTFIIVVFTIILCPLLKKLANRINGFSCSIWG